jgi:hypothetical protein
VAYVLRDYHDEQVTVITYHLIDYMTKTKPLRIALSLVLCGCATTSNAQIGSHLPINPIQVGSITVNAGVGVGVPFNGSIGVPFGTKASINWGVVQLGSGVITLGLSAGGSFSHGSRDSVAESANSVVVLARGAWHYGWDVPGLDLYGGLSSGVAVHRFHYGNPLDKTSSSADLLPGIFVGASYFVVSGFGFNAELGDDITILQLGIVVKIQ